MTKNIKRIFSATLAFSLMISGAPSLNAGTQEQVVSAYTYGSTNETQIAIDPANIRKNSYYYYLKGSPDVVSIMVNESMVSISNESCKDYVYNVRDVINNSPNLEEIIFVGARGSKRTVNLYDLEKPEFKDSSLSPLVCSFTFKDENVIKKHMMKRIANICKKITSGCRTDFDKIEAIYSYVYDNSIYHHNQTFIDIDSEAWTLFFNYNNNGIAEATCLGFAKAITFLANQAGIPAYIGETWSYSQASNDRGYDYPGHAYSVVKLYGHYYYIDVSNDCNYKRQWDKYKNFLLDLKTFRSKSTNHIFPTYVQNPYPTQLVEYCDTYDGTVPRANKTNIRIAISNYEEAAMYNKATTNLVKTIFNNSQTVYGDIDGNGVIDKNDLNCIDSAIRTNSRNFRNAEFLDFNHDNVINSKDRQALKDYMYEIRNFLI